MDVPGPDATKDSLGLHIESLKLDDSTKTPSDPSVVPAIIPITDEPTDVPVSHATSEDQNRAPPLRERKKPYVNPDRVMTGGTPRDKLSEEELTQRMARIREQNEKIKQRRQDVEEDEREFRKTQDAERVKVAKAKKVQETIDKTREQNARRKLDKINSREWDSGKAPIKKSASNNAFPSRGPTISKLHDHPGENDGDQLVEASSDIRPEKGVNV